MTTATWLAVVGGLLFLAGAIGLFRWGHERDDAPRAGWYRDPVRTARGQRWWDGGTWSSRVRAGTETGDPPGRRRRHPRDWMLPVAAAVLAGAGGGAVWLHTGADAALVGLSMAVALCVCLAIFRVVNRRMALDQVVPARAVASALLAGAGATWLLATPLDDLVIGHLGLDGGLGLAGPVEESVKLLVPLGLYLLGRLRSPRAGVALGLASGFGFSVAEAGLYAITTPAGAAPQVCGGSVGHGAVADLALMIVRAAMIEPVHGLYTGLAAAVIWRQWHRHGVALTAPVLGVVVLAMTVHSLNDSSTAWVCGSQTVMGLRTLLALTLVVVLYGLFRAAARRSVPPERVESVGRGWRPRRLPTDPAPVDRSDSHGDDGEGLDGPGTSGSLSVHA